MSITRTSRGALLRGLFASFSLLIILLVANTTSAATIFWTGDANNAWGNTGNWSTGAVPGQNDDVIYYDNPFSGDPTFAGLNNANTGNTQRNANSITFSSDIATPFAIYPQGDTTALTPNHHLNIRGGGITKQVGSADVNLFVDVELGANQTWDIAGTLVANNQIRGGNSLTKIGSNGTLQLLGNNTFSGGLTLGSSNNEANNVTEAGSNTAIGAGQVTFLGARLSSTNNTTRTFSNDITFGPGGGVSAYLGSTTNSGDLIFNGNVDLNNGNRALFLDSDVTINGVISVGGGGTAGINKRGDGVLTLTANNTFNGDLNIEAGVVNITHSGALGSTAGATNVLDGGQLRLSGGVNIAAGEEYEIAGAGVPGSLGALRSDSGNNTVNGIIRLTDDARINVAGGSMLTLGAIGGFGGNEELTLAGTGDGIINGQIASGSGTGSILKTGNGSWTFTAPDNNITGDITVQGGTLRLNGGTLPNVENLVVGVSGSSGVDTLIFDTNALQLVASANSIIGDDSTGVVNHNAGTVNIDARLMLGATASGDGTYNISAGELDISTALRVGNNGTGQLNVTGTGSVIAAGGNSNIQIGRQNGSSGEINVSGNGVVESRTNLRIGQNGDGTLNIDSDGMVIVNNEVTLSESGSGSASINVNGGSLLVGGDVSFNSGGTDIFTQTGGFVDVQGDMNQNGNGTQDYLLQGGVLSFADRATPSQMLNPNDSNTSSTLNLRNASRFSFTGGQLENVSNIDMNGSGAFAQDGGRFVIGNDGVTDLANAEKAITTIVGDYDLNSGLLAIDVFGPNVPTPTSSPLDTTLDSDLLNVLGDAQLNGTVEIVTNDSDFAQFAYYDVLAADAITLGPNFATSGFNVYRVITDPTDPSRQILQVAAPEPASMICWLLLGAALMLRKRMRQS